MNTPLLKKPIKPLRVHFGMEDDSKYAEALEGYVKYLENFVHELTKEPQTEALNKHNVMPSLPPQITGFIEWIQANDDWHFSETEKRWIKDGWMPRTTFGLMEIYLKESGNYL